MPRKRAKKHVPTTTEEDGKSDHDVAVDRLSNLPDCVIHHILSFVPTVDAVGMSLLSRRWRRMWLSVPALQFFLPRYGLFVKKREKAFNVFVERCLEYRRRAMHFIDGSVVTTLKLEMCCYQKLLAGLSKWLGSHVIMNNIKELDLRLSSKSHSQESYSLPSAVLNGRSLTHLLLEGDLTISACSMNLPSLFSLSLIEIDISRDALYNLLIGCPSLENLTLDCGYFDHLNISSQTLKHLTVCVFCKHADGGEVMVAIEAPNLVYFSYEGGIKFRMSTGLLNRPAKAEFSVWGSSSELINFFSNITPNWTSFDLYLCTVYQVKSYDLPKNMREINLPPWNNLKHMKLKFPCKWTRKADFRNFLQRLAPSLETLSIE